MTRLNVARTVCGCPTIENGDAPCHVCREYVNVRCWNCKTPRGEGPCPNPRARDLGDHVRCLPCARVDHDNHVEGIGCECDGHDAEATR